MGTLLGKHMGNETIQKETNVSPTGQQLCVLTLPFWSSSCGFGVRDSLLYECPSHLRFNFTLNNFPL